jgi:protein gp37
MAENSKIQWTNHTFNHVRGCTHVHAGCANCYAETMSKRNPATLGVWGPNGTRVVASESMWQQPLKWDRLAKEAGERHRVFCASLADVFEDWQGPMVDSGGAQIFTDGGKWHLGDKVRPLRMDDVRRRLFALIDATPNLDWLLITKRPENIRRMWPMAPHMSNPTSKGIRFNVWLLTSVSNQATADAMIPRLLGCRDLTPVLGLSAEPLLGPVDLTLDNWSVFPSGTIFKVEEKYNCLTGEVTTGRGHKFKSSDGHTIDWVIVGGESGHGARPYDVAWARDIIKQCKAAGVPVFHKQLGAITVDSAFPEKDGTPSLLLGIKDKKGGDWSEWEPGLRVREYPNTNASVTT